MVFHIVVNPAGASGGAWKLWKSIEPVFSGSGCEYMLHCSSEEMGIGDICRSLTSCGNETLLVVIGGDGTINEAVNGIADLEHTSLGLVPCGTGNDMERDMGLPRRREKIVRRLLDGRVKREADIGELAFVDSSGSVKRRRFNISSDIGFGAATCAFAERSKLKPVLNRIGLGRAIYLIEALRVCLSVNPADVRVSCNGRVRLYKHCLSAIVMNHKHEGGGFEFCPDADFTDGMLDLCIGSGLSLPEYVRVLPFAYKGEHFRFRGIHSDRTERVTMVADRDMWVHTDGEVLGLTRKVSMRILPQKLKLLV